MDVKIIPFNDGQVVALSKIHFQAFSSLGFSLISGEKLFLAPGCRTMVAIDRRNGRVLGYSQVMERGSICYLSWIAVSKSVRKSGVGFALLKDLKRWAKRRKCQELMLDSRNRFKEALFFYLRNHFEIVGTFQGQDGDIMIRMRLKL